MFEGQQCVCVCALMPRRCSRLHTLLFNRWQTHWDRVESLWKCFFFFCYYAGKHIYQIKHKYMPRITFNIALVFTIKCISCTQTSWELKSLHLFFFLPTSPCFFPLFILLPVFLTCGCVSYLWRPTDSLLPPDKFQTKFPQHTWPLSPFSSAWVTDLQAPTRSAPWEHPWSVKMWWGNGAQAKGAVWGSERGGGEWRGCPYWDGCQNNDGSLFLFPFTAKLIQIFAAVCIICIIIIVLLSRQKVSEQTQSEEQSSRGYTLHF